MQESVTQLRDDSPHKLKVLLDVAIAKARQVQTQFASLIKHLEKEKILQPIHVKQLTDYKGQNRAFAAKIEKAISVSTLLLQASGDKGDAVRADAQQLLKQLNTWTSAVEDHWTKRESDSRNVVHMEDVDSLHE